MRMFACLALLCALAACKGKGHAEVDGVLVPQAASGQSEIPEGPTLKLPGDEATPIPEAEYVRIAAYRKVPWSQVKKLIFRIEEAGAKPVFLVGEKWHLRSFPITDPIEGPTIAVTATADGKICVSPPGNPEAKCVQTMSKDQIDRAHTRRLMREAVRGYKLYEADLEVQGDISWADVVRAVDGVRTCCMQDKVAVKLNW